MSTGVEGNEDISVNVDLMEKGLSEIKTQTGLCENLSET